ncbi:MAG: tRNA pseudouridine synthase A [Phycisphaerales bacterium JB041]
MPTYRLTIAYDGTDYAGWQKQEPPDPWLRAAEQAAANPGQPPRGGVPREARSMKLEPGLEARTPGRIALRTVQAVVERAVREVVREPVALKGASRTDAGVHARCQIGVFSCSGDGGSDGAAAVDDDDSREKGGWPVSRGAGRLLMAINSRLPDDVQVVRAEVVPYGFDPILDCVGKGYSYTLWVGMHRPLWARRHVHHTWARLNLDAMQAAAAAFVGRHDFAGFAAAGHGRQSTVREVFDCTVREIEKPELWHGDGSRGVSGGEIGGNGPVAVADPGRLLRMEISGSGFLYNMVRIIAGTLHDVGRGRIDGSRMAEIIASGDRTRGGPTLPAKGLCLEWVAYPDQADRTG